MPEAKVTPRLITNSDVLHFKIEALVDKDGTKKNQLLYTWISYPEKMKLTTVKSAVKFVEKDYVKLFVSNIIDIQVRTHTK